MKRISKSRRALMAKVGPERKAYLAEIGYCEVCWNLDGKFVNENLSVHEIAKGPARQKALGERCAWLCVCWDCNSGRLNDYRVLPIERQLAIKLLSDPKHLDIAKVNELRGRAPGAITLADVVAYLKLA